MERQRGFIGNFQRLHPRAPAASRLRWWSLLIVRLRRWRELARQRRDLAMLGADLQKDLGLSRADIINESERPFWDDPLED
ncbi:DUF1127 domain-containing protein [Pseudomonas sp. LRF_L74]|uniref:DUF1127 domain-containing protein n=1 Tax=Pseudomonas sp. LRF_L74 TaxID=3369422 RepID=UPI003F5FA6F1